VAELATTQAKEDTTIGTSGLKEGAAVVFGNNHRANRNTGKEGEADHRLQKHSPRKTNNGGTPVGYSGQCSM
jgi:hypothetical protein